jgi:putative hydrolase of the HAD superfamily
LAELLFGYLDATQSGSLQVFMNLQAVFFDMGGTIETFRYDRALRIKNAGLIRACLDKAAIRLDLTDEQLADVITNGIAAYHRWNMVSRIEAAPVLVWKNYIFKELACLYETRFYEREMKPEMPAVLARIKAMGLKIGCISNVQSRGQVPTNLKEYGIFDYFSPIVLSSEYGRRKPDPAIFYHAARLANVPTSACIYVGDKIDRDISGAQGAGFRLAIQIQHVFDDGEYREEAVPDAIIHDMREPFSLTPVTFCTIALRRNKTSPNFWPNNPPTGFHSILRKNALR